MVRFHRFLMSILLVAIVAAAAYLATRRHGTVSGNQESGFLAELQQLDKNLATHAADLEESLRQLKLVLDKSAQEAKNLRERVHEAETNLEGQARKLERYRTLVQTDDGVTLVDGRYVSHEAVGRQADWELNEYRRLQDRLDILKKLAERAELSHRALASRYQKGMTTLSTVRENRDQLREVLRNTPSPEHTASRDEKRRFAELERDLVKAQYAVDQLDAEASSDLEFHQLQP